MRQLRNLAQDIIEMVSEKLDVSDAKKILYELLQDLGWEEGDTFAQSAMNQSIFSSVPGSYGGLDNTMLSSGGASAMSMANAMRQTGASRPQQTE